MGNCYIYKNAQNKKQLAFTPLQQILTIRALTWNKESYGLFDYEYEDQHVIEQIFKTTQNAIIKRVDEDITLTNEFTFQKSNTNQPNEKEDQNLLALLLKDDIFWINGQFDLATMFELSHTYSVCSVLDIFEKRVSKPWIVVKEFYDQKKYKLQEGDILKLGRLKYRFQKICIGKEPYKKQIIQSEQEIKEILPEEFYGQVNYLEKNKITERCSIHSISQSSQKKQVKKQKVCRICMGDDKCDDNPFISPCNCRGTVKYVHVQCLRFWLEQVSKHVKKELSPICMAYVWKIFKCEVCHAKFPNKVQIRGNEIELYEIQKPEGDYVIIQLVRNEKKQPKTTIVMNLNEKNRFLIGRGNENDLRISDISVSRSHSELIKENGELYIADKNSKFGTLIQLRKSLAIIPNQKTIIQVGRTLLEFSVSLGYMKKFEQLCCKKKQSDFVDYYFEQPQQRKIILEQGYLQSESDSSNEDDQVDQSNNSQQSNQNQMQEINNNAESRQNLAVEEASQSNMNTAQNEQQQYQQSLVMQGQQQQGLFQQFRFNNHTLSLQAISNPNDEFEIQSNEHNQRIYNLQNSLQDLQFNQQNIQQSQQYKNKKNQQQKNAQEFQEIIQSNQNQQKHSFSQEDKFNEGVQQIQNCIQKEQK